MVVGGIELSANILASMEDLLPRVTGLQRACGKPFGPWKSEVVTLVRESEATVKVLESYLEQAGQTSKANFAALRARFSQPATRFEAPKRHYSFKRPSAAATTLQRAAYQHKSTDAV